MWRLFEYDVGSKGKMFDSKFREALRLVGLDFEENTAVGSMWDIHPKGKGWNKLLDDKDVNVKIHNTV